MGGGSPIQRKKTLVEEVRETPVGRKKGQKVEPSLYVGESKIKRKHEVSFFESELGREDWRKVARTQKFENDTRRSGRPKKEENVIPAISRRKQRGV